MKLSSLHITSFRGATKPLTLNFSKDKNITLIYAENGNGKSSISDALICLCTDEVGSLNDKSGKDISFIKSLDSSTSDLSIKLVTDTSSFSASLSASNKIVKNPPTGAPKLNALRRSKITTFIEAPASEKYKVLSTFIDVSNISKSESELKKLILLLDRDYTTSVGSLSSSIDTLTAIWNSEGNPLGNLQLWVKEELKKDLSKLTKESLNNENTLQSWHNLSSIVNNIKTEKVKYDAEKENFRLAKNDLDKYLALNVNQENTLLQLLHETKTFLSNEDTISKCPVCEKDNSKQELLENVSSRIDKLTELNRLTKVAKLAEVESNKYYTRLQSQIEPFNKHLINFKKFAEQLDSFGFPTLLNNVFEDKDTKENYKEFNNNISNLTNEITKLKIHHEGIKKSQGQHNAIRLNNNSISDLRAQSEVLKKILDKAKSSLEILENSRKNYIDSELQAISGDVEQMYQAIHPSEGLGNVKLFLNHSFQGSLSLTANFLSAEDIHPSSIYSESHLDTLGICIFLALAKKDSKNDMILVLDDVVMSVDEKHLDRIIDLIHTISKHFAHIFITTHYRPWRERYRNNRAPNTNVQFIELRGWSKEKGITVAKPQLVLEEIKFLSLPENFHRENLAGTSGRFLEGLLDFLTFNFQSRLKRKPGNDYTLSELLDSLSKDLLKLLKVQKMQLNSDGKYDKINFTDEIYLKDTIDRIKLLKAVRNQVGAHFTYDGALVSDSDIEEFANCTIQLAEMLICPINGNLPDKRSSGSYWETRAGSIRLFPLVDQ